MTNLPSAFTFNPPDTLVLSLEIMEKYREAFLPGITNIRDLKHPSISPLYADLQSLRGRLPPVLFTCGTFDVLLDDTIFMSSRYQMAGAETEVLIVPGGFHGYCMYPKDTKGAQADVAMSAVEDFIKRHP